MNKTLIGTIIAAIFLLAIIWIAPPSQKQSNVIDQHSAGWSGTASVPSAVGGILTAEEREFDFGTISMSKGKVTHIFKIKNSGTAPVTISKIYTSCMCTTAILITDTKQLGPFGMPGHGFSSPVNETLEAGRALNLAVTYDPAAHGPAGVGRIERIVRIEYNSGKLLDITILANVRP